MRQDRQVIGFFSAHVWLLDDPRFRSTARSLLREHERSLAHRMTRAAVLRKQIARRDARRALDEAPPEKAICVVFGSYCGQAIRVAHCESRFDTSAQNGQYLGLFQMGSSERRLYGHGSTPLAQARAAHRYFVLSGRDWSPWSCKPW